MRLSDAFDEEYCCGCGACAAACPVSAISMQADCCGFLYPRIDNERCIDCGLCVQVCDFRKERNYEGEMPKAYAFIHRDKTEVATSRSGAFFSALSACILERGGVVFGCVMQDIYTAVHRAVENKAELVQFKGSKYLQSVLGDSFEQCAEYLKAGRWVLFSGTGCQTHGLLSFLRQKRVNMDRLITCDIVCHGVPSGEVWHTYLDFFEKKFGKVKQVNFRDKKTLGWRSHLESFEMESGKRIVNGIQNSFYCKSVFRPSCYHCRYTTVYRDCDFTIGDFWGIEKVAPEMDDNRGVSLVLVRSAKAKALFESIQADGIWKECPIESALQPQLLKPTEQPKDYNNFWASFCRNKQKAVRQRYFMTNIEIMIKKIKRRLG